MKKTIIMFLVIALLAITTISYGGDQGVIIGDNVRLRKEPSLEAELVMLLSINDKVEVLSQEGDWYKVNYKENTGYVFKDYVEVTTQEISNANDNPENTTENPNTVPENLDNTQTTTEEPLTSNENTDIIIQSEQLVVEEAALSILPLINSSNIAILSANTKVTVIEQKNGWDYVVSQDARGWLRKEKLRESVQEQNIDTPNEEVEENTPVEEQTQETNQNQENNTPNTNNISKQGYVNVSSVNVRKAAGTDSEVIDGLVMNDEVTVIGEENGWYKVKVNGIEGYIAKKYISDEKVSVTNRSSSVDRNVAEKENNSDLKGEEVVNYAKQFLGYKYVTGGSTPTAGFDCSGFTYYVYKNFGYSLSRTSSAQANNGVEVSKENLKLGDLVLFSQESKKIGHVGIYIGNNNFIHAANDKKGVVITSLSNSYYTQNYVTARRIIR